MRKTPFSSVVKWLGDYFAKDNRTVNTGAVWGTLAMVNTFVILNYNFFVYQRSLDPQTVYLLMAMAGLGGWAYKAGLSEIPGLYGGFGGYGERGPEDTPPPAASPDPDLGNGGGGSGRRRRAAL